jgi:predicted metal-dependent hydrolase
MEGMPDPSAFPMLPLRWHRPAAVPGPPPVDAPEPAPAPAAPGPAAGAARPEVEVRTSTRRRKTATAFWEGGRIVVVLPAHVRRADRPELVEWLVERVLTQRPRAAASDEALARRAADLADRYVGGERPSSIRWVTNQGKRWGSCTSATREIRLSHRLRAVPEWVLDATIVHELAHLVHPDHSPGFHAIADRHPRQREAAIFLEGYSLGLGAPDPGVAGA